MNANDRPKLALDDPAVQARAAAIWRSALARRAERLRREAEEQSPDTDDPAA